jgi:hypothetical protein
MIIGVLLICAYVIFNKHIKGHSVNKFISNGLKRETDRIVFATVILICALYTKNCIPGKPGLALLLSCLGIAIWDCTQTLHFYAAFGIVFCVSYLVINMAKDLYDSLFILGSIVITTLLILGCEDPKPNKEFLSQCEHLALFVAALFFLKKANYSNYIQKKIVNVSK